MERIDPVKVLFDALPDHLVYDDSLLRDGFFFDYCSAVLKPHLAAFVKNVALASCVIKDFGVQSLPDFDEDTAWIHDLSTSILASGEERFDSTFLASLGQAILDRKREPSPKDRSSKAEWFGYAVWLVRGRREDEEFGNEFYATYTSRLAKMGQHKCAQCAHCSKSNNDLIRCTGCIVDETWAYLSVSYCGKSCQSADWPNHKARCRSRRLLARAVSIARQLTRTFEAHTLDQAFGTILVKGHNIILSHCPDRTSFTGKVGGQDVEPSCTEAYTGGFVFRPLPKGLTSNVLDSQDIGEAIFRFGMCRQVLEVEWPFVGLLLHPLCDTITTMAVIPKNAALTVALVSPSGALHCDHNVLTASHTVLRARVSNKDDFVIDFTGAQYGWRECLARTVDYRAAHGEHCNPEKRLLIGTDAVDAHELSQWSPVNKFSFKVKGEIATAMRTSIVGIIDSKNYIGDGTFGGAVKKMLGTNQAEFEVCSQEIVRLAESAMAEVINGYRSQGLFRFCLTSSGWLCCTDTLHWAEVYRKLWLTEEEYQTVPTDENAPYEIMRLWNEKLVAMGGPKLLKP